MKRDLEMWGDSDIIEEMWIVGHVAFVNWLGGYVVVMADGDAGSLTITLSLDVMSVRQ